VLEELRGAGGQLVTSRIAPHSWRIEGATACLRGLVKAGKIYLQDEASQLVAHVLDARPGERILDACAAPGSKTTHIATMTPEISLIVAGDLYEHRLRVVLEAGARQGIERLRAVAHDAETALPFEAGTFNRVLVDAPCTGTGTLRRNPEIRWRITPEDISASSKRQTNILSNVARLLKRGGRLVYSTCSVEREENEDVISRFLHENAGFTQLTTNVRPGLRTVENEAARIWPHRDGADGFFIASFERRM
jgi:16S rRNA (cytosine967-C5)-methyltransferase